MQTYSQARAGPEQPFFLQRGKPVFWITPQPAMGCFGQNCVSKFAAFEVEHCETLCSLLMSSERTLLEPINMCVFQFSVCVLSASYLQRVRAHVTL